VLPYPERHAYLAQAQCTLLEYWRDCANARCRRARRCFVPLRALLSLGSLKGSEGLWLF
jgi:hypothetical protein